MSIPTAPAPEPHGRTVAIWMSGGPGAESAGNIYLLTANGAFETTWMRMDSEPGD